MTEANMLNPKHPVLIVDDDPQTLESFTMALEFFGLNNAISVSDERNVQEVLRQNEIELVLMDMIMPHIPGERLLADIVSLYPDIPVIMITGVGEIKAAVRCIHAGAFDYLTKPVDPETLSVSVKRALDHRALKREKDLLLHHVLTGNLKNPEAFSAIVTCDQRLLSLFKQCEAIACGGEPVLITGETGVGKEYFARAIHAASGVNGDFISVNLAGLDDHVFADTLFGHKKGAFTGADQARGGMVEQAAGGSIFLDEIGDLTQASQVKLLGLLQDRIYYPLGADRPKAVKARFLVATNRNIQDQVESVGFRRDLFYRLRTHHIHIPPLRDRPGDIPLLLEHYLEKAAAKFAKAKPACPRELVALLCSHDFPGNVRELRGMIYDAVGRHEQGPLSLAVFREWIQERIISPAASPEKGQGLFSGVMQLPTLKESAEALVAEAMSRTKGNQRQAASILGITPPALNKRLKK